MHARALPMCIYDASTCVWSHLFCRGGGLEWDAFRNTNLLGNVADGAQTRIDKLQHTADHHNCPACIGANLLLIQIDSDFSRLPFTQASSLWMVIRRQRRNLKPRTHESNQGYIEALEKFFGRCGFATSTLGICGNINSRGHRTHFLSMAARRIRGSARPAIRSSITKYRAGPNPQTLQVVGKTPAIFARGHPKWSPRDILSEEDEEDLFSKAQAIPSCAGLLGWRASRTTPRRPVVSCAACGSRTSFWRDKDDISEIYIPEDAVKTTPGLARSH